MKRTAPFLSPSLLPVLLNCLPALLLLGAAGPAAAERADAYQPTRIDCRICDADGVSGKFTVAGGVVLTRGTLQISADRGEVQKSPDGYQRATLRADGDNKVRFRQKADGPGEQWTEGEAERVEYDEKTAMLKLFSKASVRRLQNGRLSDEAAGEYISYDSRHELFSIRNTSTGEDRAGAGRGSIVIQPRRTSPVASMPMTASSGTQ